ncbi:MAG: FAD:protein FMN transferase [Candidatus Paceibacterota bacterium]
MQKEKIIMGMTIKIEIADNEVGDEIFEKIFSYFETINQRFSTYKSDSEISKINQGQIKEKDFSSGMKEILRLSQETKEATNGYFDILTREQKLDPSGIVKGWAIWKASQLLKENGYKNFLIDAGGDIQVEGVREGKPWEIGIRNPIVPSEIIKVLKIENQGVATSGNYVRGEHIYNPKTKNRIRQKNNILSLTVIGPNIYDADRFATAAFAMGENGIFFIEKLYGFEGYMINREGIATMTSKFENYVK